jgi:hypothetical protein
MTDCHNINALLHDIFNRSFLYSYVKSALNLIRISPCCHPVLLRCITCSIVNCFFTKRHCIFYYINDSQLLLRTKRVLQGKQMWLNHSFTEGYYRARKSGRRRGCTKRHYTCHYNRAGEIKKVYCSEASQCPPVLTIKYDICDLVSEAVRELDMTTSRILNCKTIWHCMICQIDSAVHKKRLSKQTQKRKWTNLYRNRALPINRHCIKFLNIVAGSSPMKLCHTTLVTLWML